VAAHQPIYLYGDYVNTHDRQQLALVQQCLCVVEFHFNSATPAARGGEVHYKALDINSQQFAQAMWDELAAIGLPAHGNQPVKSTTESPRSGWIDHYQMIAIVLEPLFISNAGQAAWLHANGDTLADALAEGIKGTFPAGGRIGLSAGHAYKSVNDPGAACAAGDHEADHTVDMVNRVAQRLQGGPIAPACLVPPAARNTFP
jgi:N-acetylmuramoyl-L-alanine amidase